MKIFLKRSSIVEYGTSSLFLTPRYGILQSGAAVAMLLRKVLGGKETRPRPVHFTLHVKDLLDHPFQVHSIVEAISSFSSVDLQFDSEEEQAIQDQRLPEAVIGFLASLGSCDEVSITPSWMPSKSWTPSSSNEGIQPGQKRLPAMQGSLLHIKHLMEGVPSVHISGEFMATESLRNVCATLMQGEGVQSLTVDNIEQELFDKLQPCINLPALRYLRLGARAKPLLIPEQFFRRHPRLRRLCLSSCATPLSQTASCTPPQIFPCLDHLSISTSYMPWKLKDPALAELYIEPYAIRASSAKLCSVIDSISRTLIMAINNGHSGSVSVRFPDFNGVSAEHMHRGGCSCSKTGPVSAIRRLIVEATTFDLVFLVKHLV